MKYKFKTNYVYQYFTDDKGSQGRITYTKGDVVEGYQPEGGSTTPTNIRVSVAPFKAYDMIYKRYTTLNSIDVRSSFLEEISGQINNITDETKEPIIKKYIFIKDYTTGYKVNFKKGDIVLGQLVNITKGDFAKYYIINHGQDKYIIKFSDNALAEYINDNSVTSDKSDIKDDTQPEKSKSKLFTTNNILIGLAVIAVIGIGYYIIKN